MSDWTTFLVALAITVIFLFLVVGCLHIKIKRLAKKGEINEKHSILLSRSNILYINKQA
jgi:hypothetical protein